MSIKKKRESLMVITGCAGGQSGSIISFRETADIKICLHLLQTGWKQSKELIKSLLIVPESIRSHPGRLRILC